MTIIVSEHLGNTAKELASQDRLHDYLVITPRSDLDGSSGKDMVEIGMSLGTELSDARLRHPDASVNVWGGQFEDDQMVLVIAKSEKEADAILRSGKPSWV
jgi:hypothetical protein